MKTSPTGAVRRNIKRNSGNSNQEKSLLDLSVKEVIYPLISLKLGDPRD